MAHIPDDWAIEIDTLQAVFLDQLKTKEDGTVIEITLLPNPDSKEEGDNPLVLVLEAILKSGYPNEIPDVTVRPIRGITPKQAKDLTEKVIQQANEMIGMQMLYPLAQYLKDWIDETSMDSLAKQKEAARAKDELEMEKEKAEYARRYKDGTPCTVESFNSWFKDFLAKHPEKVQWDAVNQPVATKLTGKQLFEKGAAAQVDLEALAASGETAQVNWELFDAEEELPEDE